MLPVSCTRSRLRRALPVVSLAVGLTLVTSACFGLSESSSGADSEVPVTDAIEEDPIEPAATSSTIASTAATSSTSTTSTTSTTTTTTTLAPTTTTTQVPPMEQPLRALGSRSGNETKRLQQRLLDLGFWVQGVDGRYGITTRQAVLAFQKYHGLKRTGRVDAATAQLLSESTTRSQARSTKGNLIEVDKDRQVLFVVRNGETLFALNTSTGNGQYYLERNQKDGGVYESGRSITPSGKFKIHSQRSDGWWKGDLGKIYRPKYFDGGRAIHGMTSVPARPASHGCVRVSLPAMDMLWTLDWVKWGLRVWVYGEDVPARNKPIPIPSSTTSTSSPSTSSPSTSSPSTSAPATSTPTSSATSAPTA